MINGVHHIALHVTHLDTYIAFCQALQFHCVARVGDTAWIATPTVYLQLIQTPQSTAKNIDFTRPGISHLCIQTPNMAATVSILRQYSFAPLSDPINLGTGHWYLYARMPSGDIVEIEGVPYAPAATPPWVAHVAMVTQHIDRLATFYRHITHTTANGGTSIGPHPRFDDVLQLHQARMIPTWLKGLNITLEFWQFSHPPTRASAQNTYGYRHIAFETTHYATSMTHAIAAGASVVDHTSHHAVWQDLDGNHFVMLDSHARAALPAAVQAPCAQHTLVADISALWQPLDHTIRWESS